jgi:hypothetical protein
LEKQIILTFDLEEFDLPLEFGCPVSVEDQIKITNNGMQKLTGLLSQNNVPATFFTTAFYADKNQDLLKSLSETHEIASHSNMHSEFKEADLSLSKIKLESITGRKINGFRMPRFRPTDMKAIKEAGYSYDSSVNPTYIPGRYNNLLTSRRFYLDKKSDLTEFPVSVSPLIRFPLFWLSFKNIPFPIYLQMCKMTLMMDAYLHLYFHPWEFADLESFDIPRYIKYPSGKIYSERFERLISELKKTAGFSTISNFLMESFLKPAE